MGEVGGAGCADTAAVRRALFDVAGALPVLYLGAGPGGLEVVVIRTGPERYDVDVAALDGRRAHHCDVRHASVRAAHDNAAALAATL